MGQTEDDFSEHAAEFAKMIAAKRSEAGTQSFSMQRI
jgi:hypothetical protein